VANNNHQNLIKKAIYIFLISFLFIANSVNAGGASADLSISKTDGVISAIPGNSITYTIVASNIGPDDITDATINDAFPVDLTCSTSCVATGTSSCTAGPFAGDINDVAATINVGETLTYSSTCSINSAATGTLSNTATVNSAATADPVAANNTATDADTVLNPSADLSISKVDDVDPVMAGNNLVYTIQVDNAGPSDATAVTVAETLPAGVTFVSTTGCAEDPAGVPTCTLGGIAASGMASYTVTISVDAATSGTLTNSVTVSSTTVDPDNTNNTTTEDTISQAGTTITITNFDPTTPPYPNQPVGIVFDLSVVAGTPTGTVTITDGVNSCVATLPMTSCTIVFPAVGDYNLTATYSGDVNFLGATSAIFVLGVVPVPVVPMLSMMNLLLLASMILMLAHFGFSSRQRKN
jgi:uncharacterized repeat protein (TIGR01451 family)